MQFSIALALATAGAGRLSGQTEPLTVRVSDAEGESGGPVAVVLRTYASRPVSQGRLGVRASGVGRPVAGDLALLGTGPFASFDGGLIFSAEGDAIPVFDWDAATQAIDSQFASISASINAQDGIFGVLFFTLEPGLAPGAIFDLIVDLGPGFFLTDPDGQPIVWEPRAGELAIRAAATDRLLGIDGPRVHPGSGADVEIETVEPFDLGSGVIELHYPTDVLSGPPQVTSDPRHGSVTFQVTFPAAGLLRIEFDSPADDFNSVPGALFVVHLPTASGVQLGVTRPLTLEATTTALLTPAAETIDIRLAGDILEFESDPSVFYDNFEGASFGAWSRRSP